MKPARAVITRENDALWGVDQQLGPSYDITVAANTGPARVQFPVTADRLDELLKMDGGSTGDLFIQMYSPTLGTWLPLPTTYDARTHRVTATAPHFSRFSLGFIIRQAAQLLFPGVPLDATSLLLAKFSSSFLNSMKAAFDPDQSDDGCAHGRDPAYVVETPAAQLSGCVATANGNATLLIQNTTLVPFDIRSPTGGPPPNLLLQDVSRDSLPTFVTRLLLIPTGEVLLSGHGAAVLGVGQNSLTRPAFTVPTSADPFAIATDTVIALLSILPPEREWEIAVNSVRAEILHAVASRADPVTGQVDIETVLRIVQGQIQGKIGPVEGTGLPASLKFTQVLNTAYTCLQNLRDAPQDLLSARDGLTSGSFDTIVGVARGCLDVALEAVGASVPEDVRYGLSLFNALPDLARTAREDIQFATLGRKSVFSSVTIRHNQDSDPNRPPIVLARPDFKTPGGAECVNRTAARNPHSDVSPLYQQVVCSQDPYTGPAPIGESCTDLLVFNVALEPHLDNPWPSACDGDEAPLAGGDGGFPQPAYQARPGDVIDMISAICSITVSDVHCAAKVKPTLQFTLSSSGLTMPPAPGVVPSVPDSQSPDHPVDLRRTKTVTLSGDFTFILDDIEVTGSSAGQESGSATLVSNTCSPDCAAANYTRTAITFTLDQPELVLCPDERPGEDPIAIRLFTRIRYRVKGSTQAPFSFGPPTSRTLGETPGGCWAMPSGV